MSMTSNQHLTHWLKENVVRLDDPDLVNVSDFRVNWERMAGDFMVTYEGNALPERFPITLELNGRVGYFVPMFHSPCGVPASYATVEFSAAVNQEISNRLDRIFPKFRAVGRHKDLPFDITAHTPISERIIDKAEFELCKRNLSAT
jgi:hypothetical protein